MYPSEDVQAHFDERQPFKKLSKRDHSDPFHENYTLATEKYYKQVEAAAFSHPFNLAKRKAYWPGHLETCKENLHQCFQGSGKITMEQPRKASKKRGRRGMSDKYASVIEELLETDPDIKPEDGLSEVKKKLLALYKDDVSKIPTDKQIKSKISNLKHQIKRKQELYYINLEAIRGQPWNRFESAFGFTKPEETFTEVSNDASCEALKLYECDTLHLCADGEAYLEELEDLKIPL